MKACIRRAPGSFSPGPGLVALFAAVALAGCVIVPVGVFTPEPFPAELRHRLAPGQGDRDQVRLLLGSPTAHKAGGQYWFYARSRTTWGVIAGSSSAAFSQEHWLAVQFDAADRVVFLEHSDHPQHCLSNGICMLSGLFGTRPSEAVMTAPLALDQAARSHQPGPGSCALYLFLDKLPWPYRLVTARFTVDGQHLGRVDDHAYLFLTHPAGDLNISADVLRTRLSCEGGHKLYLQARLAPDKGWENGQTLALVSETEGEAALRARKLALAD